MSEAPQLEHIIQKTRKEPRISRRLKQALDLWASGECATKKAAAERVGMSAEHLSRSLSKDHVQGYLERAAKRKTSTAVLKAAHVKVNLLDAVSEKVRSEVATELLAMGGIAAPRNPGITINNNNSLQAAGYIIKLKDAGVAPVVEELPMRDITPERSE